MFGLALILIGVATVIYDSVDQINQRNLDDKRNDKLNHFDSDDE